MVNKCSAYGCKSGYTSRATPDTVTFHCYPLNNPSLLEKWNAANPRPGFTPTKWSRICSLHFTERDFFATRQDSNTSRKKAMPDRLKHRYLKPDAVPTIFRSALACLPTPEQVVLTAACSPALSSPRQEAAENNDSNDSNDGNDGNDSILNCSLLEIQELLDSTPGRPAGFQTSVCAGQLCVYMLEMKLRGVCQVACSVCIGPDNRVASVGLLGTALPLEKVQELAGPDGKVRTIEDILSLMAQVKVLKEALERV